MQMARDRSVQVALKKGSQQTDGSQTNPKEYPLLSTGKQNIFMKKLLIRHLLMVVEKFLL